MNPKIKALLDREPPRDYEIPINRAVEEKNRTLKERHRAWEVELEQLRKELADEAVKRKSNYTAEDLSDKLHRHGGWFLCSECFFGMDDYYSSDEKQMTDNRLYFCPCCGSKIVRNESGE